MRGITFTEAEGRDNDLALDRLLPRLKNPASHLKRFNDMKIRHVSVLGAYRPIIEWCFQLTNHAPDCLQKAHLDSQLRKGASRDDAFRLHEPVIRTVR